MYTVSNLLESMKTSSQISLKGKSRPVISGWIVHGFYENFERELVKLTTPFCWKFNSGYIAQEHQACEILALYWEFVYIDLSVHSKHKRFRQTEPLTDK